MCKCITLKYGLLLLQFCFGKIMLLGKLLCLAFTLKLMKVIGIFTTDYLIMFANQ